MRQHSVVLSLFVAASIAVAAEANAAVVSQVVFSDQTYADADWTIVNQFGLISAGQQATGGHPGSYRQVALGVGQDVPFVGQLNKTFVYDPSINGANHWDHVQHRLGDDECGGRDLLRSRFSERKLIPRNYAHR